MWLEVGGMAAAVDAGFDGEVFGGEEAGKVERDERWRITVEAAAGGADVPGGGMY